MSGGLYDPLGTDRPEMRGGIAGRLQRLSAPVLVIGLMAAGLAALLVVSWLRDTGDRGLPVAVGSIERVQAPPKAPAAAPAVAPAPPVAPPPDPPLGPQPTAAAPARADQDVEIQNGVRIVRPHRDPSGPGAQTLPVVRGGVR